MLQRATFLPASLLAALLLAGCSDSGQESKTTAENAPPAETPATPTTPPSGETATAPAPAPATGSDGATANAAPPAPGRYASDRIVLVLNADGSFEMSQTGGAQSVRGRYEIDEETISFSEPAGDIGDAKFPMECEIVDVEGSGFGLDGSGCGVLAGLTFKMAT